MTFVFIYGPPAVGKLTVAKELSAKTGFRLFDNHLVVDATLALYDFGTPGFAALREALWRTAFSPIARDTEISGVIFTFNPENTVAQGFIDDLFALFANAGANVRAFELTAPEAVIEERLTHEDRSSKRKLMDPAVYRKLRDAGAFATPVIKHNRVVIDTSKQSAVETAAQILSALGTTQAAG